ncbi:hypothetical protein CGC21_35320 [Leishmania donovani]|uniref:Uncharacterized protein n=1 Tax=Leishmania donovani TaxID=5661 RepID=A0A504XB17_LEIDO|nr:hypothetical protein CGC21_35320 [Leishmania donovani]
MLRFTSFDLGRWSSRDFLRGRSKRAGAVHTRHTHGRQGRYKRLSSITSSIRDGRRHASNHMQGGLGLKLGGGLFGLRIPRQHQLSHMSKEEFELEVHGHPNITNPYREHLDEHPDLKSVMMNATVALRLVVLLPKAARRPVQREGGDVQVPEQWSSVVRELKAALGALAASARQALGVVEVHLATLESSVCCRCAPSDAASTPTAVDGKRVEVGPDLETGVARLYRAHCLLRSRLKPTAEATRRHRRPAAFMGAALRASSPTSSSTPPGMFPWSVPSTSFTSSVLASASKGKGMMELDRSDTTAVAGHAAVATRKVLKEDIDLNSEVGVWRLARSSLPELLRWHYCARDPRAHNHDALPHHRRSLPVLLVVDYSTIAEDVGRARAQSTASSRPAATLMPRHLSLELESAGFKLLAESSLLDVAKSLEAWVPARQWVDYVQSCAHAQPRGACRAAPTAQAATS